MLHSFLTPTLLALPCRGEMMILRPVFLPSKTSTFSIGATSTAYRIGSAFRRVSRPGRDRRDRHGPALRPVFLPSKTTGSSIGATRTAYRIGSTFRRVSRPGRDLELIPLPLELQCKRRIGQAHLVAFRLPRKGYCRGLLAESAMSSTSTPLSMLVADPSVASGATGRMASSMAGNASRDASIDQRPAAM